MANTRITYLYRDEHNYKKKTEVIVSGELSENHIKEIIGCLNWLGLMIPHQVGLPENRFMDITDADHSWFEITEDDFEITDETPTINMSAEELLKAFLRMKDNWDEDTRGKELGLPYCK